MKKEYVETLPVSMGWLIMTLIFAEVIVVLNGQQFASGVELSMWTRPLVEVTPRFFVIAFYEEVIFRLAPVLIPLTVFRGKKPVFLLVAFVASASFGLVHVGYNPAQQFTLAALGFMLFGLCFSIIKERGVWSIPTALGVVVMIHFLYNLQIKLLAMVFM